LARECSRVRVSSDRPTGLNTLYGLRYIKKTRTKFYTPAYAEWEAKWMPQAETVPAT